MTALWSQHVLLAATGPVLQCYGRRRCRHCLLSSDVTMPTIAPTSPYIYLATAFFSLSACSSDLLFIRFSLCFGFLGLVLAALSGYDPNGSFDNIPLADGIIDIPMLINMVLLLLNVFICIRLIRDEVPRRIENEEEEALFNFFQARCGTTHVEFREIFAHGRFLRLPKDSKVPRCRCRLYLVIEGQVECACLFHDSPTAPFVKRSGEFFDIRMFNLFTFPIGFDNTDFSAVTLTDTKLFMWELDGLNAMRQVPMLTKFWEFTVLRSLASAGVRHHLKKMDTLYDSLLIPEEPDWLEGAPSRDFLSHSRPPTILRQFRRLRKSFQLIPPHGVRHFPGILEPNPTIPRMEASCKECSAPATEDTTTLHCVDCENQDTAKDATRNDESGEHRGEH